MMPMFTTTGPLGQEMAVAIIAGRTATPVGTVVAAGTGEVTAMAVEVPGVTAELAVVALAEARGRALTMPSITSR